MRRDGHLKIDGTEIDEDFIKLLDDPTAADLRSWVMPKRRHIIVHGEEDQVTPLQLTGEAKDVIESAGGKVELLTLPGPHPHPGADLRAQIRKIGKIVAGL